MQADTRCELQRSLSFTEKEGLHALTNLPVLEAVFLALQLQPPKQDQSLNDVYAKASDHM